MLVSPRTYQVREVPDPQAPPDGLLLKVRACGVCGSDLRRWQQGPPEGIPWIIAGHEIAGVIEEVGAQVKGFLVGERLAVAPDVHCGECYYCRRGRYNLCDNLRLIGISPGYPGGFAEKMALTGEILHNGVVHRMPEGISFLEGALAEPASSVLATHARLGTGPEDVVVVMGAGPIGCLHVAVGRARGARVVLSEPAAQRRYKALDLEPELVVDPVHEDLEVLVRQLTSGRGADIVICANPVAASQSQAVEIVRKGGKVALFGGVPKSDPLTHLDANRIHYGEIEVVGAFSYHPTYHELALEMIRRRLIPSETLITHTFPIDEINQAFEMAASGSALKVIVSEEADR